MITPLLGDVPTRDDLIIKLSGTGITFLAKRELDPTTGTYKYTPTSRFKRRYSGSKKSAVDINGNLWLSSKELEKHSSSGDDKKKGSRNARLPFKETKSSSINDEQIYSENPSCENIVHDIIDKKRKKSYSINKREVRQRLLAFINTQKGRKELYFWTVTFPEGTPDDICYQAFNTWLTLLRKRFKKKSGGFYPPMLRNYLWVAERQQNGTIHYHIAIPHYMDVTRANAMMRGTLKNLAKMGAIPYKPFSPQIARYNGVDICKHRTTRRIVNFAVKKGSRALANYLTKYVTKNDSEYSRLAWHNSRGFSALFTAVTLTLKEFNDFNLGHFLNRVRIFEMNFATFIPWLYGPPPRFLEELYKLNSLVQAATDQGCETGVVYTSVNPHFRNGRTKRAYKRQTHIATIGSGWQEGVAVFN